jgi:hypothetical protein
MAMRTAAKTIFESTAQRSYGLIGHAGSEFA